MSHPAVPASSVVRRRFAALAVGLLALGGCGGAGAAGSVDAGASVVAWPGFGLVTPQQAAAVATDDRVTILDVRTPEEFARGHLDGAVLVDVGAPTFASEVAGLDASQPYLVYCRSGNRSGQATAALQGMGFDQLWDMDGGVIAWTSAGLPLVR